MIDGLKHEWRKGWKFLVGEFVGISSTREATSLRGDRLARQWKVIQLLLQRKQGLSAAELANELNYSVRNIYRDLDTLQKAGFPLYNDRDGRNVRWTFVDGFRHATSILFTADELMAFEFARSLMKPVQGTVFEESLEQALQKIRSHLPDPVCAYLDRCRGSFCVAPGPIHDYANRAAEIKLLNQAIDKQVTVQFFYNSFSTRRRSKRKVDPYGIFYHEGTFYLVGHCHQRKDLRNFALDRLQAPTLTEKNFKRQKDFTLKDYMSDAFGAFLGEPEHIVLKFNADTARYIRERFWHPSQSTRDQKDGSCILELTVPVSDEIARWILSWSPGCEVLEPVSLRSRIEEIHDNSLGRANSTQAIRKSTGKARAAKDLGSNQ